MKAWWILLRWTTAHSKSCLQVLFLQQKSACVQDSPALCKRCLQANLQDDYGWQYLDSTATLKRVVFFWCVHIRNIIPILLIVAGDAKRRSCVSKRKFTLPPKEILSPLGSVSKWLSSRTEFRDSIHSGSTSPSQTIQNAPAGALTTLRCVCQYAISPLTGVHVHLCQEGCLGILLGFITCT